MMISLPAVIACGLLAFLVWTAVGLAVARIILPEQNAWVAPALGYALCNAAALPLFALIPLTASSARIILALALIASLIAVWRHPRGQPGLPPVAVILALLLAIVPALAVLPKDGAGGTVFAIQMFDHSKAALIDEMLRSGLPPVNPFAAGIDGADHLAYYYLWHFAAALVAAAVGAHGWEADAGLTFATALASLTLMMSVAQQWGGRRAGYWVVLLSSAVSARFFLNATVWGPDFGHWITGYPGLQVWLVQASWVPQHLAAANCVCLAPLLLGRLGNAAPSKPAAMLILSLALTVAAGFESSTYVGGILFGAALPFLALTLWTQAPGDDRVRLMLRCGLAGILTLLLIAPFLRDQYDAVAARQVGPPIGFYPFEVFESRVPDSLRRWLDLPGYWLVQLPVDLPAIAMIGLWAMLGRRLDGQRRLFAIVTLCGLIIPWLFESRIANNDLGWRAILPAVMGLTVFAAADLARASWRRPLLWLAIPPLACGLYGGIRYLDENWTGQVARADPGFAASADMWRAVREVAAPDERVANNPDAFSGVLNWPVNLSWALLADRRSCFAGRELAMAYAALPRARIDAMQTLFASVFAGSASAEDVHAVGEVYGCRVIALSARDGAWQDDPFARDPLFRLMREAPGRWRIYRVLAP